MSSNKEKGGGQTASAQSARGLMGFLDTLSSNPTARKTIYASAFIFFIALILLPSMLGIFLKRDRIGEVFTDPALMGRAQSAILWSFAVAFLVSTLDLLVGLPLAWFIVRSGSRWVNVVDTLADIPFIIPTAALGFSSFLFWSSPGGVSTLFGVEILIPPGVILVMLLHFAFSFPVIVRVIVGELLGYKATYEIAAKTLGAQPFTAVRTVTLPIIKPALVAAFLLAFGRSLSETGATIMVAGPVFENGPVFIKKAKDAGLEGPLVFVSFILIVASVLIFALIRFLGARLRLPMGRVSPNLERGLSRARSVAVRDVVTLLIFAFFVLAPSLFVSLPATYALLDGTFTEAISGRGVWGGFWQSMLLSYGIGVVATVINIVAGLPVAIMVARNKLGKTASTLLDMLVNVPIMVPSVALGVSLSFFWNAFGSLPELWVLILSHTTITYTYFVRAMAAAVEGVSTEMEETARTLGGRPLTVFRRITLPLTKYSVFSGAVLVFTRSVDETGAAIAVSRQLKTAPVLLVDWVKGTVPVTASERALGVSFLILTSFLSLLILRLVIRGKR